MSQVLVIFGIWLVWTGAEVFLTAPKWAWYVFAGLLGIGAEVLLDRSSWWLGIGLGGGAAVLMLLTDLLLVATDSVRVSVLRSTRTR